MEKTDAEMLVTIIFKIDPESFQEMERLHKRLGTPNLATTLFSAVQMVSRLYEYKDRKWRLAATSDDGRSVPIDMPEPVAAEDNGRQD